MFDPKVYFKATLRLVAGILGLGLCSPAFGDQTVSLTGGANYTFSVTADGTQPFTYKWYKDDVFTGDTNATYVITNATNAAVGSYKVEVINSAGFVFSDKAIISSAPVAVQPPIFTTQPISQAVSTGVSVTFTTVVSSTVAVTYQWRKDGAMLLNGGSVSGATSASLTLTGVTSADIGDYDVIATNSAGSVTSAAAAVLIVTTPPPANQAPIIITQPAAQSANAGETVSFSVVATALPAPIYTWKKGTVTVATSASPTLTLTGITTGDAGSYSVDITNSEGTVSSTAATLTVLTDFLPVITVQPAGQSARAGSVVFFTSRATGSPAPRYQWQKDTVNLTNTGNILGATSTTLVLNNVSSADAANYRMLAINSLGTTISEQATFTFNGLPTFLTEAPANTNVATGTVVALAVTVGGEPTPTLQWRQGEVNLANSGIVSGATSSTLILTGVTPGNSGNYYVVATNSKGSTTAGPFAISVNPSNVWFQPVTTGKDTAISAPGATGNLKWQVSNTTGSLWTDLANDSTYAGVNTDTLRITNAAAALSSVSFRLVSVGTGEPTVLKTARVDVGPALLPFPVGISADAAGNLYVADTSTDTIAKINSAGQVATWAGTSGQTGTTDGTGAAARFNNPSGVASGSDGSLVITDNANATIRTVSPAGAVVTLAGSTTARGNVDGTGTAATFSAPIGITRDTAGTYYVADSTNHTLRKIAAGAVVTTLAGSAGQSGNSDGTGAAARFNNLSRVAADQSGNIFVADTTNNMIRKVSPAGVVTTLAGLDGVSGSADGTGTAARFNQPGGVAVDPSGYVYVADTGNSTIRRISPSGVVITIAGLPGIAGHKDGNGTDAWFNQPRDLCVSSFGFLFVADTGNGAIRRIATDASVTTVNLTAMPGTPDPVTPLPLPEAPSLPAPLPAPTLPTGPTPVTPAPSSGGGGGGAPSLWFYSMLGLVCFLHRRFRRA